MRDSASTLIRKFEIGAGSSEICSGLQEVAQSLVLTTTMPFLRPIQLEQDPARTSPSGGLCLGQKSRSWTYLCRWPFPGEAWQLLGRWRDVQHCHCCRCGPIGQRIAASLRNRRNSRQMFEGGSDQPHGQWRGTPRFLAQRWLSPPAHERQDNGPKAGSDRSEGIPAGIAEPTRFPIPALRDCPPRMRILASINP